MRTRRGQLANSSRRQVRRPLAASRIRQPTPSPAANTKGEGHVHVFVNGQYVYVATEAEFDMTSVPLDNKDY